MLEYREMAAMIAADPSLLSPASLRLACGHDVPNAIGTVVYNYYDLAWSRQTETTNEINVAIDTSGRLPHGITFWCYAGTTDNSRVCCQRCGEAREAKRKR